MSRNNKLFQKIKNNPNNVTFSEIRSLLEEQGFELKRISGSHHIFNKDDITFVIPVHNKRVKSVYTKRVIDLIEINKNQGES